MRRQPGRLPGRNPAVTRHSHVQIHPIIAEHAPPCDGIYYDAPSHSDHKRHPAGHFALSPCMAQQLPLPETTPNPSDTARSASSEQAESHISSPTSSLRARQTQLWKAQAAHGHETLHHIRFTSHAHQACADAQASAIQRVPLHVECMHALTTTPMRVPLHVECMHALTTTPMNVPLHVECTLFCTSDLAE